MYVWRSLGIFIDNQRHGFSVPYIYVSKLLWSTLYHFFKKERLSQRVSATLHRANSLTPFVDRQLDEEKVILPQTLCVDFAPMTYSFRNKFYSMPSSINFSFLRLCSSSSKMKPLRGIGLELVLASWCRAMMTSLSCIGPP